MAFLVYNLILFVLSPAIALFILWRILVTGKSRGSWREQLGLVKLSARILDKPRIWIHAVSVGESVASAGVVAELKKLLPEAAVVLSTTTQTGQEMARKSVKEADEFIYYPFDLLPCVELSIRRVRPTVFAATDTEIWPNFRHIARRHGVRTAVINGTVSDKTLRGARWVRWVYRWTLSNIDLFCMQSQADVERIVSLGAHPDRVRVTGNCKADEAGLCAMSDSEKDELRASLKLPFGAPVFVAGSTNPGEDGPVLNAFVAARKAHPDLRLIVAPRQIERGEEIAKLAGDAGLSCARRSDPEGIRGGEDVIVLDTFGELARVYALADVTFVGGSLIPKGCHSILQPIAQGKPVFFGPYTFKARDLVGQAKAAGVGFEVRDGEHLGRELVRFLDDRALLDEVRARCERMMAENRGASRRTAEALAELYAQSQNDKAQGKREGRGTCRCENCDAASEVISTS